MAKVIVIDDSLSVCFAIERMLRSRGMEVISHRSGEAALENLEPEQPDLVLCDLVLPDIEGFQICTFIKRSPVLSEVPVIVISGIVDEEVRAQAKEVGAEAVLKKPFASDEMLTLVEDILRRRGVLEAADEAHGHDTDPESEETHEHDEDELPTGPVAVESNTAEDDTVENDTAEDDTAENGTAEDDTAEDAAQDDTAEDELPTGPVAVELDEDEDEDEDEDDTAPVEIEQTSRRDDDATTFAETLEPEDSAAADIVVETDARTAGRAPRILLATPDPRDAPKVVDPPPKSPGDELLDELEERLAPLASIEALRFACILSPEGELRGYGPAKPTATDLAALPQLMRAATNTATHTRQGDVGILTLEADKGVLVVKPQEEGHLMILGLGDLSVLGKARYLLRRLDES